jgi:hypothetical protein
MKWRSIWLNNILHLQQAIGRGRTKFSILFSSSCKLKKYYKQAYIQMHNRQFHRHFRVRNKSHGTLWKFGAHSYCFCPSVASWIIIFLDLTKGTSSLTSPLLFSCSNCPYNKSLDLWKIITKYIIDVIPIW